MTKRIVLFRSILFSALILLPGSSHLSFAKECVAKTSEYRNLFSDLDSHAKYALQNGDAGLNLLKSYGMDPEKIDYSESNKLYDAVNRMDDELEKMIGSIVEVDKLYSTISAKDKVIHLKLGLTANFIKTFRANNIQSMITASNCLLDHTENSIIAKCQAQTLFEIYVRKNNANQSEARYENFRNSLADQVVKLRKFLDDLCDKDLNDLFKS